MQTFQSFWYGDDLPPYQRLAAKSFVDHGHAYVLYAYKTFEVPAGVELRDAREILPESRIFFYGERADVGRGSVSGFSNLFRYHLLNRKGNWWVDADVVCLSGTVPDAEIFMGWEYENVVGSAILKLPAGHAFARLLCEECDRAGTDVTWGVIGPQLVTRLALASKLTHAITAQPLAYPVQSMDALHLLIPARRDEVAERVQGAPFLHIWNEVMRRAVIFPWMAPPDGSYMAGLFARHQIGFDRGPAYTADQIHRLSDNYFAAASWSHDAATNAEIARLRARLQRAEERTDALTAEAQELRDRIQKLLDSTSWRLTSPLRRAVNALRK